mgnify:CR=1 FL=1
MAYEVPDLPYAYDALEPHIDEATMKVHHDKHHQAYVDKANAALEGTEWADKDVEDVVLHLASRVSEFTPELVELIQGDWTGRAGHERGRRLAEVAPVLLVAQELGLVGDVGQPRRLPFAEGELRRPDLHPVVVVRGAVRQGRAPGRVDLAAVAVAIGHGRHPPSSGQHPTPGAERSLP